MPSTPQHDTEDFAPGTLRLFDEQGELLSNEVVLYPAPVLDDFNDPLNFSERRKWLSLACILAYTFAVGVTGSAIAAVFVPFSEASGLSIDQLNKGTSYTFFLVGFAPLITNPLALVFGKRGVYLVSLLATGAIAFWSPHITSNSLWVARSVLTGFFISPIFALTELSIADVFFSHQRATPIAAYVSLLYISALLAPLLGAYIYLAFGYHAVFYFAGGANFLAAMFCFIFLEETNYARPASSTRQDVEPSSDVAKVDAKSYVVSAQLVPVPTAGLLHRMRFPPPQPSALKLLWRGFKEPLLMLRLPIIWWCGLQYGIYQVWFNIVNGITAVTLASPPYLFDVGPIGLAYLSPVLLTLPGVLVFGWGSDRFRLYMARRNNGISEPEHLLWLGLPMLLILVPGALLMLGLGPAFGASPGVFIAGMGIINAAGSIGTATSLNYVFDVFHDFQPPAGADVATSAAVPSAPYLVSLMMPSMSLAFGFTYAITPWLEALGYQNWSLSAAAIGLVFVLMVFPMIIWGKRLRMSGAAAYYGIVS